MIILIALIGAALVCFYLFVQTKNDGWSFAAILLSFFTFIALLFWPINYYSEMANIQRFKETQKTYERIRAKDAKSLESAAIQVDIAAQNRWLTGLKYWNATIFDIFIPDEIEKLEPIK